MLPPGHPCLVGLPPHVEAAGRLWDEADVVLAIGSDLDGVQTQNFMQPQPETLIAIGLEAPTNYRVDVFVEGDAGEVAAALADGVAAREATFDVAAIRAEACGTLDATALRFLDAIRFAVPRDGNVVVDMCIPGYWLAGFYTPAGAAAAAGAAGLGHAWATRSRPRWARRCRGRARRSRSPATAASCSRAANSRRWRRRRSR